MTLQLSNVKCGGCVNAVKEALQNIQGLSNISVTLPDAVLEFNLEDASKLQEIKDKLKAAGYPAV
jgi:copper chaperone CopZ